MVKMILQSLAAGLMGASLFFSFFMTLAVAVLALIGRLTVASVDTQFIVVSPAALFRVYGLPLSVIAFAVCFVLGLRRFRRLHPTQPGEAK